jgi:hypothetical protein
MAKNLDISYMNFLIDPVNEVSLATKAISDYNAALTLMHKTLVLKNYSSHTIKTYLHMFKL